MTKKFIILCGRYRFFFFLIVLPWFGHVFSNKGRFGHKWKLPGYFYFLKWTLILPSANLSRSLYAILSNLQPCENTETHAEGHRMVWSWPALIATWLFQSAATAHLTGRVGVPKNVLGKIPRIHCVKRKMQTIPSLASPTHRLYDSPKTKFPEVLCS